jgi:hypothetical protein
MIGMLREADVGLGQPQPQFRQVPIGDVNHGRLQGRFVWGQFS